MGSESCQIKGVFYTTLDEGDLHFHPEKAVTFVMKFILMDDVFRANLLMKALQVKTFSPKSAFMTTVQNGFKY